MAVTLQELEQAYLAYFGRPADFQGVAFYTSAGSDVTIADVAATFGTSAESQALYGTDIGPSFVNAIYQNLFGRDADSAGLLFWTARLAHGDITPGGAALAILQGATNGSSSSDSQDLTMIQNKVAAATEFTNQLNASGTKAILAYSGAAAADAARSFLGSVTADPATLTAAEANISNVIASLENLGGTGQSFTLTSGVDNIKATSGNDTIIGAIGSTSLLSDNSTLNALDTIDGGNGTDTLVIMDQASTNVILGPGISGRSKLPAGITVKNVEKLVLSSVGDLGDGNFADFDVSGLGVTTVTTGTINGNVALRAGDTQSVTVVDTSANGGYVMLDGGASQTVTVSSGADLTGSKGAVVLTDNTGTNDLNVDDGTDIAVIVTNAKLANGTGAINVGTGDAGFDNLGVAGGTPTGTVTISESVVGDKANNLSVGDITVVGGTTVSITETAVQAVNTAPAAGATNTNHTVQESAISVTGTDITTSVSVSQTASVAAKNTTTAKALTAETDTVTFADVTAGTTVTVGGLSFTASANLTADQVAAAFANLANGAVAGTSTKGTYSGTFTGGFATGSVNTTTHSVTATGDKTATATIAATGATAAQTQAFAAAVKGVAGNGGVAAGVVTIADKNGTAAAGTITTVSVDGWGAGSSATSNALSTLSLANSNADFTVNNKTTTGLSLTLNHVGKASAVASVNLDGAAATYTTLDVTTTGADSTIDLTAAKVSALSVSGSNALDLATGGSTLTALSSVTVSGGAGLTIDVTGLGVKSVNAGGTSGDMTVTGLDATVATYVGGSGVDTLSIAGNVAKAITLGAGDDTVVLTTGAAIATGGSIDGSDGTDTLSMDANDAITASASTTFASKVFGFEVLDLTGDLTGVGANSTVNLAQLGGFNSVIDDTATDATSTLTLDKMASGGTLTIDDVTAHDIVNITNAKTGTADVLNIIGVSTNAAGNDFGTVKADYVETLHITASDESTPAQAAGLAYDTLVIDDTAATSVTVTGNATLDLTLNSTKLTSVDASGMTGALVYTTTGTTAENVLGGAGDDVLIAGYGAGGTTSAADTLVGGAGNDTLVSNEGLDVLTGGSGADTFAINAPANVNSYATITDASAGDLIEFAPVGTTATFSNAKVTLAATAVFQDYANAAINAGGAAGANGYITWFQYGGDTYIVESQHNAATLHDFQNGTDVIVKLVGLHDLSTATLNAASGSAAVIQINS